MKKSRKYPPRWADRLLESCCGNAAIEDLQGDAHESFYQDLKIMPSWKAKANYWRHILSLVFSYAIKSRKQKAAHSHLSNSPFHPGMFKNYVIVATRNLVKHKFFTSLNVIGLAVGMSISLLLIAMLSFLWTYDNFHVNKDRIYRVITRITDNERNPELASAPPVLAEKLRDEFSGIDKVVRVNKFSSEVLKDGNEIALDGYFVDPDFLSMFTFPLIDGDGRNRLSNRDGILITQKAATKFFGDENPIGKIIELRDIGYVEITGVLQDIPKNSHMQFEALLSYEKWISLAKIQQTIPSDKSLPFRNAYVYLMLPEKADAFGVEKFLNHIPVSAYSGNEDFTAVFELQPLLDIAPGRELSNAIGPDWGYASLSIFIVLTLLILLPACFNYTNISISRALKRMKEIGLRKTMGGQRSQIFFQFITETVIITFMALCLSYYIFVLIRSEFLEMIVSSDALELTPTLETILYFIGFALIVGFIAGVIPALYFSKLSPIEALKNKPIGKGVAKFNLRKALIVFQFALSLGFIMGVVIVFNQYRYSLNFDFGFDQKNILDVEVQGVNPQLLKNEFGKLKEIQSISMSSNIAGASGAETTWVKDVAGDSIEVAQMFVDEQYISNMNLQLKVGSNFANDPSSEKMVIVNEEFVKAFKLHDNAAAINKTFVLDDSTEVNVIGVVKDFHYADLRLPIRSFFFRFNPKRYEYANIKVLSDDMATTLADMETTWSKIGGEKKFMARFFDDEINDSFSFYFAMIKICGFLGFLAISISCLGLLGMVVFTVENRMKEVGVRKVMGASALNITVVLSKDFVKLMVIAAFIAIPLAYLFFDKLYLSTQHYYHINVGVVEIVGSLLIMISLGLATILSQTLKAARANPVDTLRYE
jgi:ABC-type antimicrobial peptide transport system permease subunit